MHEQLHRPPAIILHRFCSVAALISSSHVQVSFMPPAHFSNFIVQRGTIIIEGVAGAIDGMPPCGIEPVPIEPIIERSNIIVLDILNFSLNIWSGGVACQHWQKALCRTGRSLWPSQSVALEKFG
jgi:hypothetical protein